MAKLKRAVTWRRIERPYTRKSKFKKKNYVRATPNIKIVRFNTGNPNKSFDYTITLNSKRDIQIRHNAIESGRQSSNRYLEKYVGKGAFFMQIHMYPHHILRENPLAAGAGADRMSTGMKMSFGKPVGLAARIFKDQTLVTVRVDKQHVKFARDALLRISHKLPCSCSIKTVKN
jgi:large subunit ribosomal protein L10e